jgi:hypothetical protein
MMGGDLLPSSPLAGEDSVAYPRQRVSVAWRGGGRTALPALKAQFIPRGAAGGVEGAATPLPTLSREAKLCIAQRERGLFHHRRRLRRKQAAPNTLRQRRRFCLPPYGNAVYINTVSKAPLHTVVETPAFTARVKKLGLSGDELASIYDVYAADPGYGKVIRKTGGLRKGRVAKDATGKSGGYRVFSFFADRDSPAFLLWILDKSDDDTLTDEQEKTFKALTTLLKKELRK